jgi:DNA-binding GntR family transcriptional regulator
MYHKPGTETARQVMTVSNTVSKRSQPVALVIDEVRRMIASGELLPGQQIRQESMAERLGVSRLPVREGLRQLTADGLVSHVHNVGFTVTRLSQDEFDQIYTMRYLLETQVIRGLPRASAAQLAEITAAGDAVTQACQRLDLSGMRHCNQDFHFAIFRLSDQGLIVAEIQRLWNWATPYHAVYLFSHDSRETVLAEHAAMIEALRAGDNDRLVALMDQHRHGSETQLAPILAPNLLARPAAPGNPH